VTDRDTKKSRPGTRQQKARLPNQERHQQLLETARAIIKEEGPAALTLIRLAERAGVTKPITYRHFRTREALLVALYREFDDRQTETMANALSRSGQSAEKMAKIVATAYVDCTLAAGAEIGWLIGALQTTPELQSFLDECRERHHQVLQQAFSPYAGGVVERSTATAVLGAADALSAAAASGALERASAIESLRRIILALIRTERGGETGGERAKINLAE
jgi:AcrR family transcriptional regulator